MSDLDKFNYECEGQVSLFDVFDEKNTQWNLSYKAGSR